MPKVELNELFGSAWGLVKDRRREIETGPYGTFERVLKEELAAQFRSASRVANGWGVSETTARRWLNDCFARYIVNSGTKLFLNEDVKVCMAAREAAKVTKSGKREAA